MRDDYYPTCKDTVPAPDRTPHLETEMRNAEVSRNKGLHRGHCLPGKEEGQEQFKNCGAFEVWVEIRRKEETEAGTSRYYGNS